MWTTDLWDAEGYRINYCHDLVSFCSSDLIIYYALLCQSLLAFQFLLRVISLPFITPPVPDPLVNVSVSLVFVLHKAVVSN